MMAALQNKRECGKRPKKTFAPPTQKLHSMIPHGSNSPEEEETLGISCPEAGAMPHLPKASLDKKEKETIENGPSKGQEKKKVQGKQPAEKKEKEQSSLTDAEFEEIVQIVLQKSLQECLEGMGSDINFAETSCAQPIVCTQSDKEPGIASSATDNVNADGERIMAPQSPEISVFLEDEVVLEIRTSKTGPPVPAPSEKKFNRLSLSKRKKEAQDEKMENTQGGHEHREKDQLKKMSPDHSHIRSQEKGEGSGFDQHLVWVQCSSPNCEKWRQLRGNIDPSVLPDNWSCDQNPDLNYNRCDVPQENWTGRDSDVAYASYVPGSIVWAKQYGYPWWPGMVESDPDLGEYFLFGSHLDCLPCKYHVTFFGETVSRAWIPVNMLKNFRELSLELTRVKKYRNKDYSQKLGEAIMMAQKAEQISIQERINLFGFWSRYNESDSNGAGKDLMLSGANSPEFCFEKEEEDLEMEKEEKKDATLPHPKPVKIKTKKSKPRGMADGQDKTVKSKIMKTPLGGYSKAPPASRMGRKERQRDTDQDQPGMADGQDKTMKSKIMKTPLGGYSKAPPASRMGRKERQRDTDQDQPGPKKKFKVPQNNASAASLFEEKEVKMVPKGVTPPACHGACPSVGKEGPRSQEPLTHQALVLSDNEASSDLDMEQLMEDIGREMEEIGEPEDRDSTEEFPLAFFEE